MAERAGAAGPAAAGMAARLAAALAGCRRESVAYAACATAQLPEVVHGGCEREFTALRACFAAGMAASRPPRRGA
jgi:hypothetical protein